MNLLLFDPGERVATDRVRVAGRRLEHVRRVLHSQPGDVLRVGELNGRCGRGTVRRIDAHVLELEVELDTPPPPPLRLALALALPRPPSLRRVLQAAAALGVKEIALLHSARVEKSFWQSPLLEPQRLEHELRLGLEQSRDTVLPRVRLHRSFHRFAACADGPLAQSRRWLLAHPGAARPCPHAAPEPLGLLVGPEGGWVEREVEQLRARGAEPVGLGPRPLRVETAVPVLIGRLAPAAPTPGVR